MVLRKIYRKVFKKSSLLIEQNEAILRDLAEARERAQRMEEELFHLRGEVQEGRRAAVETRMKFAYVNPEYAALRPEERTKVLICGYYGAYNLGDELMLETLLDRLKEREDLDLTVMLALNEEYDAFEREGVRFVHYPQTRFDYEFLAAYYDAVIFGGGALLGDHEYSCVYGTEVSLATTLVELSRAMIRKGKKCIWYGLSSNRSVENPAFVRRLNEILPELDYCSMRDGNSIRSLWEAGVEVRPIRLDHDPILAHPALKNIPSAPHSGTRVGVIYMTGFPEWENAQRRMLELLIGRLEKRGGEWAVDLIPFYGYMGEDAAALEKLRQELDHESVTVRPYVNTMREILQTLAGEDYVVSMRYHGALLALIMQKPVLGLVFDRHPHYPNKMAYAFETYGNLDNRLNLSEFDDERANAALDRLFASGEGKDPSAFLGEARAQQDAVLAALAGEKAPAYS